MECTVETLVEENTRTQIIYPLIEQDGDDVSMIVEIGTFVGGNIIRCAKRAKELHKYIQFYAVDNWEFENVADKSAGGSDFFETFMENVAANGVEDYIIAFRGNSADQAVNFADGSLDAVFFDGNHTENGVYADLVAWVPKIKPGGIACGHDYPDHTVKKVVNKFFDGKEITTTTCGSSFSVRV
jgi:hypothetical protein